MPQDLTARAGRPSPTRDDAAAAVPPPVSAGRTLAAALLGFFLITLDASVVNVALPAVGSDLHGGLSALQWVVDGYTLAFAALMLSTGALSDRIGAGRAFAWGVAVFAAASLACGAAPGLGVLIAARVLQGAAAAVVLPSSLALVRQAYPDAARRARAISLWAVGGSSAIALGPVAGGALTTAWNWRGIFLVNLPFAVLALLLPARSAARSERRRAPLDAPGQLTAVVALAALTFAVVEGGSAGWAAAGVAAVATAAFFLIESRHPHPVVPLGLFRNRVVAVSIAAGSALSVGFFGMFFVLGLFFQEVRGQSALTAGLMFLPMTLLISTVNVISGRLTTRYGPRLPMLAGQLLMAAGLLLLLPVGAATPVALLAAAMVPLGVGGALAVPPLTAAAMGAVPAERAGLAAGVLNAGRQVAGGLSVALFGSLVADQAHFLTGMRRSLLIAAALVTLTALATALALRPARTT
ncbi:MFS transporter [Actinacidiphila bryophytorum]|uniref:MFS transporter, DHA2 family, methylenomycin A resistance protein n=1 Tax=Actinacidiphila bryophytorum TaxID=1436133 RepID=A0A9W4GZJ0_9ACTN|nr:MFS transporter [Actinacidiphila bryophytorum]MBM9436116.1 MFS transporter [Actinacidiphila bryophytorum]MBN6543729.1 MFS transporter [Actinacidiphila bryophytorum]CAG7634133.1 MFS transporter, DHA2 family, methylenomycin A resistance protein [Actinacidiphila bryophytorum]